LKDYLSERVSESAKLIHFYAVYLKTMNEVLARLKLPLLYIRGPAALLKSSETDRYRLLNTEVLSCMAPRQRPDWILYPLW